MDLSFFSKQTVGGSRLLQKREQIGGPIPSIVFKGFSPKRGPAMPPPVDCTPSQVLHNPVLDVSISQKNYFGQEEEEMKLCLTILSVPQYMFNGLEYTAILSHFLTFITGSSSRLLHIRFSADLAMYWFPVYHFRCKEFKPLMIWKILLFLPQLRLRPILTPNFSWEGSCPSYLICIQLHIVVCFLLCLPSSCALCTLCCQFLWIVHFVIVHSVFSNVYLLQNLDFDYPVHCQSIDFIVEFNRSMPLFCKLRHDVITIKSFKKQINYVINIFFSILQKSATSSWDDVTLSDEGNVYNIEVCFVWTCYT